MIHIWKLTIRLSVLFCAIAIMQPGMVLAGSIDVPLKQWVALAAPDDGKGIFGGKHVTPAYCPLNGRIYFTGGDYSGPGGFEQSYRQETYSLSIAERFADKANRNTGWRLEYPYCGPSGSIQPKHPDYVGWAWDTKRNLFWLVPGVMEISDINCPGETSRRTSDPGFLLERLMTFDPVTRKWTDRGSNIGENEDTWMSSYDPLTDTLIRMGFSGGSGAIASVYHIAKNTWTNYTLGVNAARKEIRLLDEYAAIDVKGRVIYGIDGTSGRLHRYRIDSHRIEDLGSVPGGAFRINNKTHIAWDSVNKILSWYDDERRAFHVYHPDTRKWESNLPIATDIAGVNARGRLLVFDPQQNVHLLMCGTESNIKPYFYLYRYGIPSGDITPP